MIAIGSTKTEFQVSQGDLGRLKRAHGQADTTQQTTHNPQPSKRMTTKPRFLGGNKERGRENTHRSYQSSSLSGIEEQLSSSQGAEPEVLVRLGQKQGSSVWLLTPGPAY